MTDIEQKVWLPVISCHTFFPHIKTSKLVLVAVSEVDAVNKRVAIMRTFFNGNICSKDDIHCPVNMYGKGF